ncbi:MAG: FAD-dependent monooxygenase, partial [Burkholderiales bacterium]
MDTDVLVVGAGPTGLMLANQLGRRRVRALVIDRHAGPSLQTRALDLFGKLDDTRFNLILIGQPAPPGGVAGLGDPLHIHSIPSDPVNDRELARARVPQPSFYLLRPDGHV